MAHPDVVSTTEGGVVALLLARDAHMLVEALNRSVRDAELSTVVIGVSGSLPQAAVASGLAPAGQAAAAARLDGRTVGWFDELTLGAVVSDEQVRSRVWTLTRSALDALAGDGSRDSDLLPSLEAFLYHNGSWEGAARALGVHRHTLRARMARVEERTGLSLGVADNRALILLALRSRPEAGT